MAKLIVNVDHIATVRQARLINEPDPVAGAALAELAGCHGIIVHLREDRRHIQDRDVQILRQTIKTKLNLEMAATAEMISIAKQVKPDMSCLVPEKRQELTTEGGLDVAGQLQHLQTAVSELKASGIIVSLFVDPDREQILASQKAGADFVEIHTGHYSDAETEQQEDAEFEKIAESIKYASSIGLRVNVGHGLNYRNTGRFVHIREIEEFSIGHSIIARAVIVGIERAVREMLAIIRL